MIFQNIWNRILANEGAVFHTISGLPLTYRVEGEGIRPSRTNYFLHKRNFEVAFERMPIAKPSDINEVRGPSYVFAILTDPRISNS